MMGLLAQFLGLGGEIAKARTDLKKAELEARASAIRQAGDQEGAWEKMAADNARSSWLDEFWTVVLAIPLILSFIPYVQPFVVRGFDALADVPEWYRWAVLASISFAFARRKLPNLTSWTRNR